MSFDPTNLILAQVLQGIADQRAEGAFSSLRQQQAQQPQPGPQGPLGGFQGAVGGVSMPTGQQAGPALPEMPQAPMAPGAAPPHAGAFGQSPAPAPQPAQPPQHGPMNGMLAQHGMPGAAAQPGAGPRDLAAEMVGDRLGAFG